MRNEPQPGFRISQITAFTTIGDDDEEGVVAMEMNGMMMPFISADITRLTEMREWAKTFTFSGIEVTERTFVAAEESADIIGYERALADDLAQVISHFFPFGDTGTPTRSNR